MLTKKWSGEGMKNMLFLLLGLTHREDATKCHMILIWGNTKAELVNHKSYVYYLPSTTKSGVHLTTSHYFIETIYIFSILSHMSYPGTGLC